MFTGIIEGLAEIKKIEKIYPAETSIIKSRSENNHHRVEISIDLNRFKKLKIGDSIAINGVCLTIARMEKNISVFQVINETLQNTSLLELKEGDHVNVERSLMVGGRLEGHFVLGHVDCTGRINKIIKNGKENKILIKIEKKDILGLIARKGSVAIDGISLTVVNILKDTIEIALIPHTLENTTLGIKNPGDLVNIEADVIARYISKIYQNTGNNKKNSKAY
ncbi:MAG: riboflavin synthase [Thermoproteota archaeon]|nr:riboflavin synthase [Thermoproteota archaeon]